MVHNPYIEQFYEDLRARYPVDGVDMTYSTWISENTRLGGRKFSYEDYGFQPQIVDDMSPDLSVIKPSQVGMTEVQVRKFLAFLARNRETSGIFSFPNEKMFKKNSKTRIKPIVNQPAFASSVLEEEKPQRSMDLYQICSSFAHITGMTEGDATSTPSDILFHDETDLSDQMMLGLFQSRLQNSKFKITQKFSTPTHPGFGIDASYSASDQHEYMVCCSSCNTWQVPTFDMRFLHMPGYDGDGDLELLDADVVAAINLEDTWFKCEDCSRRLDLGNPRLREWVATYPTRKARGYRIRPTSTSNLNPPYIISQLLKMKQLDNLKGWRNTVLGETYSDGNSKLEPEVVKAVMRDPRVPEVGALVPVVLGCDMGRTCHLSLGVLTPAGINPFLFEQVPSDQIVDRIVELSGRYRLVAGAADRHPYTPTTEQIRDVTKRVVLPVEYRGAAHINIVEDEYDQIDYVQINRTRAIDDQVRAIQRKMTEMRGYGGLQTIIVEQLCDMVRIESEDKPATWEKLTGNDHFLHSLTLMRAAVRIHDVISESRRSERRRMVGVIPVKSMPLRQLGMPAHG